MSAYLFPVYVLAHLSVLGGALYLARVHKAPGALLVAMIAGALVYDNFIVSIGAALEPGETLRLLSLPRFYMHALLTPFMMIAATQLAAAGGIRWAQTRWWKITVWVLVVAMIVEGALNHLVGLQIVPACFDGTVRYTANLSPSHFCTADAEILRGSGPPIPSIVGNIITFVVGFSLWRQHGWIWLMAGSLVMFVAAAVPMSTYGMAPGNAGEVVLLWSYGATLARFGRFPKSTAALAPANPGS